MSEFTNDDDKAVIDEEVVIDDSIDADGGDDLEDDDERGTEPISANGPLWALRLDYSAETFFAPAGDISGLASGQFVVIPTRFGKDIARVAGEAKKPMGVCKNNLVNIDRRATEIELQKQPEIRQREGEAAQVFQEKITKHKLNMKLVIAHYVFDESRLVFFFSSDTRIDFRDLVKDLATVFKMRIELRQIAVRDEARLCGGLGMCGRPVCCKALSDRLRAVSIRMAKEQNLSLNSLKISGQCGRLLCCLAYENDWYSEARRSLPVEGTTIRYDGATFQVTFLNLIDRTVQISGDDGRTLEIPAPRFVHAGAGRWQISE